MYGDDGIRLWLDGKQVIDGWTHQGVTRYQADCELPEQAVPIRVEYHQQDGVAAFSLLWQPEGGPEEPIPAAALWHDARTAEKSLREAPAEVEQAKQVFRAEGGGVSGVALAPD